MHFVIILVVAIYIVYNYDVTLLDSNNFTDSYKVMLEDHEFRNRFDEEVDKEAKNERYEFYVRHRLEIEMKVLEDVGGTQSATSSSTWRVKTNK
jgi:hypothetical protein